MTARRLRSRPEVRQVTEDVTPPGGPFIGHVGDASALLADARDSIDLAAKRTRKVALRNRLIVAGTHLAKAQQRLSEVLDAMDEEGGS